MKGHPRAGQPTYFVEKFYNSLFHKNNLMDYPNGLFVDDSIKETKHNTIRMGWHFKPVDELTLAVWTGKPYRSKQIKLWTGPIRAVNIVIQVRLYNSIKVCKVIPKGNRYTLDSINKIELAKNDGLSLEDFISWFKLPIGDHDAQILIWNPEINY